MKPSTSTVLGSSPYRLGADGTAPLALSFTRFVSAHGGSNSLRDLDRLQVGRPLHAGVAHAALTFTRNMAAVGQIGEAPTLE